MTQIGDYGIDPRLTREAAVAWASRRWGCGATADEHAHPTSIGDSIATITVTDRTGQQFRGIGYSGMAPLGWTVWYKAAIDLLHQESQANLANLPAERI